MQRPLVVAPALIALTFSLGAAAEAQSPNVLLLVDTSGSMEYLPGKAAFPECSLASGGLPATANDQKSRWIELQQALVGQPVDSTSGAALAYKCFKQSRSTSQFRDEFGLDGRPPYDFDFTNPFHRILGPGNCVFGVNQTQYSTLVLTGGNAFSWPQPNTYFPYFHPYNATGTTCTGFDFTGGILDFYKSSVRFGLMTFDSDPVASTGVSCPPSEPWSAYSSNVPQGCEQSPAGTYFSSNNYAAGLWSYYVTSPEKGHPPDCSGVPTEVGSRNPAAPPWEGRMVGFGPDKPESYGSAPTPATRNEMIRQILLGSRPWGGTPIAGMLEDAEEYLWFDDARDPLDTSTSASDKAWFSPRHDQYVEASPSCRDTAIVLLTDGEPNLDLRPKCEQLTTTGSHPADDGLCPYDQPWTIAQRLFDTTKSRGSNDPPYPAGVVRQPVKTYVVGFALDQEVDAAGNPTGRKCDDPDLMDPVASLTEGGGNTGCNKAVLTSFERTCCTLNRIAYYGGTSKAVFPNGALELKAALDAILADLTKGTKSYTLPVFATGGAATGGIAQAFRFFSSSRSGGGQMNRAVLERQRTSCSSGTPTTQTIDPLKGDDFTRNVSSHKDNRRVFTYVPSTGGLGGDLSQGSTSYTLSRLPSNLASGNWSGWDTSSFLTAVTGTGGITAAQAGITNTTCLALGLSAAACWDRQLKWLLGQANGLTSADHRCPDTTDPVRCSVLGGILHSTPALVNRPSDMIRDETYQGFASTWAQRPPMLLASSRDGFLHAFKIASNRYDFSGVTDQAEERVEKSMQNELWAFIPPAVVPQLQNLFGGTGGTLLDGVPVVRDVVASPLAKCTSTAPWGGTNACRLERDAALAHGAQSTWRTVLVQAFHSDVVKNGYFAVDVTDPDRPFFLWQLVGADPVVPLFAGPATPAITTLFFDDGTTGGAREIAVAVLPGGYAASTGTEVARLAASNSFNKARPSIRRYNGASDSGRALTIVRLDTGEIIKTFRRGAGKADVLLPVEFTGSGALKIIDTPFDSPITGEPVAFPGDVGTVADRIFVGDEDGALWRIDLSSTNPANWKASLFFDTYTKDLHGGTNGWKEGQPIATPAILSVDLTGAVTVAVSTGSQESLEADAANNVVNYVWALRDVSGADPSLWYRRFEEEERVTGPMTVFGQGLYFTTFKPSVAAGACGGGDGYLWGMHYMTPVNAADKSKGGLPMLKDVTKTPPEVQAIAVPGALMFGAAVDQSPSCVQTGGDSYDSFTGGYHTTVTNISPATYKLVAQMSSASGNTGAGTQTNFIEQELETPPTTPTVDSWAAIVQ